MALIQWAGVKHRPRIYVVWFSMLPMIIFIWKSWDFSLSIYLWLSHNSEWGGKKMDQLPGIWKSWQKSLRKIHDSIHVSVPFSQIISPSPSPSETYLNINLQFSFHIFVSLFSSCTFYWPLKILKENPWLCACCASWIKGVENRSPVTHPPKTKSWPSAAAAAQGTPSRWTRFLF